MIKKYAPYTIILLAFIGAFIYTKTQDAQQKILLAGLFGILLGLGLLLQAVTEWKKGRIRGKRVYVDRTERAKTFFLLWLFKRTIPGSIMLVAGIWYWISNL